MHPWINPSSDSRSAPCVNAAGSRVVSGCVDNCCLKRRKTNTWEWWRGVIFTRYQHLPLQLQMRSEVSGDTRHPSSETCVNMSASCVKLYEKGISHPPVCVRALWPCTCTGLWLGCGCIYRCYFSISHLCFMYIESHSLSSRLSDAPSLFSLGTHLFRNKLPVFVCSLE